MIMGMTNMIERRTDGTQLRGTIIPSGTDVQSLQADMKQRMQIDTRS